MSDDIKQTVILPKEKYSAKVLWLIIRKAEELGCSPSVAVEKLLDEAVKREEEAA